MIYEIKILLLHKADQSRNEHIAVLSWFQGIRSIKSVCLSSHAINQELYQAVMQDFLQCDRSSQRRYDLIYPRCGLCQPPMIAVLVGFSPV